MSLNTTDNETYREWEAFCTTEVEVRVRVSSVNGFIVPDDEGHEEVVAIFKKMLCEDYWEIEKHCQIIVRDQETNLFEPAKPELDRQLKFMDYQEFKCQLIKRMWKNFSLFELKHGKNGTLTENSYNKIMRLPAPVVSVILDKYQESINISDAEDEVITKQAAILFSKNSRGVENACEAVSLFCLLGNFAEKFKLNRFEIPKLPYKEYVLLRTMVSKENNNIAAKNAGSNKSKSRKVSIGGKTIESRGIVVPDVGQRF